jgi:hypothetical protein
MKRRWWVCPAEPLFVIGIYAVVYIMMAIDSRFGDRLETINKGLERDGVFII